MRPLTRDSLKKGAAPLARKDPALGRWIRLIGPLDFRPRPERFHSLCRAIISQQLSAAAARSIHGRFVRLFAPTRRPTPRKLLDIRPRRLKRCGLSEKKVLYLRELARAFENGPLRRRRFAIGGGALRRGSTRPGDQRFHLFWRQLFTECRSSGSGDALVHQRAPQVVDSGVEAGFHAFRPHLHP